MYIKLEHIKPNKHNGRRCITYKKLMKLLFKVIIGIIVTAVIYFGIIIYSFGSDLCGNEIIETKISPNSTHKIIIFQRNCGATTDFSTQISVLEMDENIENKSGNIFSADSDHGKAELTANGIINTKIKWINEKTVLIEYDKNVRVFQNEESINNINIRYKIL